MFYCIECTSKTRRFLGLFDQRSHMLNCISDMFLGHSEHGRIETWAEVLLEKGQLMRMCAYDCCFMTCLMILEVDVEGAQEPSHHCQNHAASGKQKFVFPYMFLGRIIKSSHPQGRHPDVDFREGFLLANQ